MTSAPGRSWPRLLAAALGQPGLRPLVAAQFVSLTGSQITALALPTLAVLRLDAGPLAAGLLFALGYGMRGLTAPLVGVLVDSIRSPRRLLVGTDLLHAVVMASVPATYLLDLLSLPYLLVVAAISGILAGVTDIAVNAVLPRLVPADQLVDANSSLTGARATGQIIGPALGGMLLQFLGAILAVVVDAVSYLLSAALFGGLRGAERPASADAPTARGRPAVVRWRGGDLLGSARAGLRTFRGDPLLIRLALAAAALNVGGAGLGALYTLYAYRSLGLSPSQVGAMWAVHSGAALLAVATASRVVRRLGLNGAVAGLAPVAAAALLLIPAASLATHSCCSWSTR